MTITRKTVRVDISLPPEFLERVDAFAQKLHRSRSGFILEALRVYMDSFIIMKRGNNDDNFPTA